MSGRTPLVDKKEERSWGTLPPLEGWSLHPFSYLAQRARSYAEFILVERSHTLGYTPVWGRDPYLFQRSQWLCLFSYMQGSKGETL